MAVVIVILLLTYRSPVLWLIPVISAGTALFVAQAVIYFLAKDDTLTVNAQSSGILTVIVFGAGTDYALLLVARYREELRRHEDRHEAMAFALHRAGPAILASGATVIAGMLCLLFATMNSTKGLGPVAAIGVAVGLLVMLTLLPALLVVCGRWIFWPVRPSYGSVDHTRDGFWARHRRPHRPRAAAHLGRHVASCSPSPRSASSSSTPPASRTRTPSTARPSRSWGSRSWRRHFPAGSGSPVMVLANADQAAAVKTTLESVDGVDVGRRPGHQGRPLAHPGDPQRRPRLRRRDRHASTASATPSPTSRAPTRSPAATPPPAPTPSARPPTTTCGSSRSSSASCC